MPARLIVNADDFGLTPGVNRAVAELAAAGVLSSATLMAAGPAFADAVQVAAGEPRLGVGCHVVLTDGVPIAPGSSIPSLLGEDGRSFRPRLGEFVRALLAGRVREDEIVVEAEAQVDTIARAGLRVTHLDTHKHAHVFPVVLRGLLRVARSRGIPAIRNPFEPQWSIALQQGSRLRRLGVRALGLLRASFERELSRHEGRVLTPQGTLGISATGHLDGRSLTELLEALPDSGVYELCCHPGYDDADLGRVVTRLRGSREIEREALLDVLGTELSRPGAPRLVSYGELE